MSQTATASFVLLLVLAGPTAGLGQTRPRARDLGVPFDGTPGANNAITDVAGVEVGMVTLIAGEGARVVGTGPIRTGVTAIHPRGKNGRQGAFAAFAIGNGNGDMTGTHWVDEAGVLETPLLITNTLSVGVVRDAAVEWMVKRDASGPFWYPVVAETSDGTLNDMKGQHVTRAHALQALDAAAGGPVPEGNVGGGTGMNCNGFKGGTGTSSRRLEAGEGGWTVGVLVQCNYGTRSELRIAGVAVGREITGYEPCVARRLDPPQRNAAGQPIAVCDRPSGGAAALREDPEQGSIIVVVATDAPLTPDQLERIVKRVSLGMGRLGSIHGNGSGDIFIAFSTANRGADDGNSATAAAAAPAAIARVPGNRVDPLFLATVRATEEAIVNAMVAAETMTGADYHRRYAIPHDQLRSILKAHGVLRGQ
jgi:D-aminopeptidase